MNNNSLAHTYVQKQTSWIDDPFDLKGAFTGVVNVSNKKSLSSYAEELVSSYAKYKNQQYELSLSDLPNEEKNELARLYIESTDRDIGECIHGNDLSINSEFTCALLAMLNDDCQSTRQRFAEITRNNIISYYKDKLEDILTKACEDYLHSVNNENGIYACRDMEHGDIVWRKF